LERILRLAIKPLEQNSKPVQKTAQFDGEIGNKKHGNEERIATKSKKAHEIGEPTRHRCDKTLARGTNTY